MGSCTDAQSSRKPLSQGWVFEKCGDGLSFIQGHGQVQVQPWFLRILVQNGWDEEGWGGLPEFLGSL